MIIEEYTNKLRQEYCQECHERMLRAREILEQCGLAIPLPRCCDQLFQEFDSLQGAARAINIPELERFYKALTGFTRFLKSTEGDMLNTAHRHTLTQAVEFSLVCGGNLDNCIEKEPVHIQEIIDRIDDQISER